MGRLGRLIRMDGGDRRLLAEAWLCLIAVRLALWVLPFRTVRRVVMERAGRAQEGPAPGTIDAGVGRDDGRMQYAPTENLEGTDTRRRGESDPRVERVVWAVGVGSRYVPRATCLTRALAVQWLLADPRASLRVGVQRGSRGELEAHAWLELEGQIVVGAEEAAAFVPLPPLSGEAR